MADTTEDPSRYEQVLYTARVDNAGGTAGHAHVHGGPEASAFDAVAGRMTAGTADDTPAGDAVDLPTGAPESPERGFNPEQFLAMAWSTCLGETLKVVLRMQKLDLRSHVSVEVDLHRDPAGGLRFAPRALIHIEDVPLDHAQELAEAAHARCPVSKLLAGTENATVTAVGG